MSYGWEGRLVRLAPIDVEALLEPALRWMNDPEITEWLAVGDFPTSRLAEREWLENVGRGAEGSVMWQVESLDGQILGTSGLFGIDYRHGTAKSGMMIGEKAYWGRGFGTDAARLRSDYAFHVLGLRMLYSSYLEGNPRTPRMLSNAGYRECGRYPKQMWKRGAYRDHVLMYLDRETWAENRGADVERA